MTIPTEIYTRLTASERIRAAVSALARNDDGELQTLKETCPKKAYLITDPNYSEAMQRLFALALGVEFDLQRMALDFLQAGRMEAPEASQKAIVGAATLEAAWGELLAELGIPRREMSEAGPLRHPAVEVICHLSAGEDDGSAVESCVASMRAYLAA